MPVFEHDDELTEEEFKRQQKELNDKIFRKTSKELFESLDEKEENGKHQNSGP